MKSEESGLRNLKSSFNQEAVLLYTFTKQYRVAAYYRRVITAELSALSFSRPLPSSPGRTQIWAIPRPPVQALPSSPGRTLSPNLGHPAPSSPGHFPASRAAPCPPNLGHPAVAVRLERF